MNGQDSLSASKTIISELWPWLRAVNIWCINAGYRQRSVLLTLNFLYLQWQRRNQQWRQVAALTIAIRR